MSGRVCYTYTKSTPDGMANLRLFGQKSKVILKEYLKNTTPLYYYTIQLWPFSDVILDN